MPCHHCSQNQTAKETTQMRGVVNEWQGGTQEYVECGKRDQALQRGFESPRMYRQMTEVKR